MSESMVERVGRAMKEARDRPLREWNEAAGLGQKMPPWESDGHIWLGLARAAIVAHEKALAHAGFVIVPREPNKEMRICAVQAMHKAGEPFREKLKAEGRNLDAILLEVSCSSHITDPVWRAMLDAALADQPSTTSGEEE